MNDVLFIQKKGRVCNGLQGALYSDMEYLLKFTAGVGRSSVYKFTPPQPQVSSARRTHQALIRYSMALIDFTQQRI